VSSEDYDGNGTCYTCNDAALKSAGTSGPSRLAELASFDTIRSERVPWLWRGYVSYGAVTSLSGRPKVGKGTLYCWLTAQVTTGQLEGDDAGNPRGVLILTSEDALTWSLKPRLRAAGADTSRVYFHKLDSKAFRIPQDVDALREWVKGYGIGLVIIDPLVEFIDGRADTHKSADTRQALAPLTTLTQQERLAVLAVYHLNKGKGTDPLLRQEGSAALTQITRGGLFVGPDPEDPDGADGALRVLAALPSNLCRPVPSLLFEIESRAADLDDGSTESVPVVRGMGDESQLRADDLLADRRDRDEQDGALSDAVDFLAAELSNGPQTVAVLRSAATGAGIAWRTVERAKARLGIRPRKTGGAGMPWEWSLKTANRPDGVAPDEVGGLSESPVTTGDRDGGAGKGRHVQTLAVLEPGAAIGYRNRCSCVDGGTNGRENRCGRCYGHRAAERTPK
jgi:putative DNA primase/helicase